MAFDRSAPKKLPWSEESLLEVERRLKQIQDDLRELRTRMGDAAMETVDLKLGTFLHCLDRIEPLARQFIGELEQQIVVRDVQAKRMQKIAEKANKIK